MFKKFLFAFVISAGLAPMAKAGQPLVAEAPVNGLGSACTTVSISTSAWTKVPAAGNTAGRTALFVTNHSGNSADMIGLPSVLSTAPTEATTVQGFVFTKGTTSLVGVSDKIYLYLRSLNTAAESASVCEGKQ